MNPETAVIGGKPEATSRFPPFASIALLGALICGGALTGCSEAGKGKANRLKDEGNSAVTAADKLVEDANAKYVALLSSVARAGFPGNRAEHEAAAREVDDLFVKAIEQYRLSATRFEEAAKLNLNPTVSEYFSIWSQIATKSAERRDVTRGFVKVWLDKEIDTREKLEARIAETERRYAGVNSTVNDLLTQAKKIETEKASEFQ